PTEQEICRDFGVSKTTAREVVRTLAALGLVEVRHGRRMRVRAIGEWNHLDPLLLELNDNPEVVRRYLADLHDVRMLLEPEIAARAALKATAAHVDRMRAAVEQMAALVGDPDTYLEVDLAFHRELAAASDNLVLGLTFIVSFVGVNAPIAYLIGGFICLGVAVVLTQLAKEFTGAGGYFLYVSRTFGSLGKIVGSRCGWITTWLYFLYDPVAVS